MNVKDALKRTLADADGGYISGAALAETLGVSRNAVWKAVKALEAEGYIIESVTSKGYRLAEHSNRLSEELISAKLNAKVLGSCIKVYSEIDSTNNAAKEMASAGAAHGTVIVADKQTGGRGRLGRTFESPAGTGIYMSVIIRPDFSLETSSMMTAAAAVAVAEAVESLSGCEVRIKWVNDPYINGRKICGILTEASLGMEMRSLDHAIIGIGINVRSVKEVLSPELSGTATSIEDETGLALDRNALCAAVIDRLEHHLSRLEERTFLESYRKREFLTGHRITANIGGRAVSGKALGIDDNANLILETDTGEVLHLNSGEANLCRISEQ